MKVAVVYNRDKKGLINVFGMQNKEQYPEETIQKVVTALEKGGHDVHLIPADRFLLSSLKKVLPKLSRRRPNGIVLNLSLGVQGKCRYTHVPAILEVAGIPYTGSSPMGHILALDKVVTKQILMAAGLPTPNYRVLGSVEQTVPELKYPLIVKPRSEAASFGLKVVGDEKGLHEAVSEVLNDFKQHALVEEFINGREVNVGILGNFPPQAFPVLELELAEKEQKVYSNEIKFTRATKNKVRKVCPADFPKETTAYIQKIAIESYHVLNIYDFGRVDIRLDEFNRPFILEMNSMASINPMSSFVLAARAAGYSYTKLINRIIDVAVKRYAVEEPEFFGDKNASFDKSIS
jgi:D-alanine-D-alanine ligase